MSHFLSLKSNCSKRQRLAQIPADVILVKTTEPEEENTQPASENSQAAEQVAASSKTVDSQKTTHSDSVSTNEAATHQVSQGESFWTIAKQYGTTVAELRQLNPIDSPYLRVGSFLKLPATIATPAKAAEPPIENTQPASKPLRNRSDSGFF